MQKGFGLIGILIVVAIIGVLGIGALKMGFPDQNPFIPTSDEKSAIKQAEDMKSVLEQKNDETADWRTYRNEEYGFEVRYPNDSNKYEIVKTETNIDYSSWWIKAVKDPSKNSGYKVSMSVHKASSVEGKNVVNSFRNSRQEIIPLQIGDKQLEMQTISHTWGTTSAGDPEYILWIEPSGRFIVTFSFVYTDSGFREEMLKIVETFTFK